MATRSNSSKSNTGKRNTSSRSNSNTRKSTSYGGRNNSYSSRSRKSEPLDDSLKKEILLILVVAVCIVLFLCNFKKGTDANLMGPFGSVVKSIMFGLFGFISYVLPIGAIIFTLFRIFNQDNPIVTRKLISASVLVLLTMMICELATESVGLAEKLDIADIYKRCSANYKGGGVIGGTLAYLIHGLLGNAGTWMFIIVLALICIILITGKSIFSGIKQQGQAIYDESREDREARRRYNEERRRERLQESARRRQDKRDIRREKADLKIKRQQQEAQKREVDELFGGKYDQPTKGVSENTTLKRVEPEEEIIAKNSDDRHPIQVKDIDTYNREKSESVVAHVNIISEGSDLTREITPNWDDAYDDYEADNTGIGSIGGHSIQVKEYHTDNVLTGEDSYAALDDSETRGFDINNLEEDPAFTGVGGKKPESSYSKEYGNTMARTGSGKRVSATASDKKSPAASAPAAVPAPAPRKSTPSAVYKFPPISLLTPGKSSGDNSGERELKDTAAKLQHTLETFGVRAAITNVSRGPSVTRYEITPEAGVKVSKIVGLQDDIKLSLAATDIRIEAPIPGKSAVGIEVPNKINEAVAFRDLIESDEFKKSSASLPFAVGKDIAGTKVIHDIAKMPHVLIAGATGSGKSVCINTIIMSILYKCHPDDVRLIMVDPKVVELSVYNNIPHLLLPVVTDPKKASNALKWAVMEMDRRYKLFAEAAVRDLKGFNEQVENKTEKLPHILIIVDELADLMMVASNEVEESICRLAQLARACGIHLVIATQRPSVDVITGLIKANMPSRVAFAVSSGTDSRTILDMVGAEKLLGKGDMLFYPQGLPKPSRVQGAFVPDSDVNKVVKFLRDQNYVANSQTDVGEAVNNLPETSGSNSTEAGGNDSDYDELFAKAGRFIIDKEKASIGALQRLLKIGFNRAARIMDQLAEAGVVGEEQGTKPREILMDSEQFEILLEELGIG